MKLLAIIDGALTEIDVSDPDDAVAAHAAVEANARAVAIDEAITQHEEYTQNIHGIADTALLETQAGAQTKVDAAITAIKNGVGAGGDTLFELDARIAVIEALGSLATDAELIAAVAALLGSADPDGDTLGELQALIGLRMLKSANLSDLANVSTALTNLGFSAFVKTLIDDADADAVATTLGLRSLQPSTNIDIDDSVAGQSKPTLEPIISGMQMVKHVHGLKQVNVRCISIQALPAATYNNGTLGSGATLTANANGALSNLYFDGITPTTDDLVCINAQGNHFENGLWIMTAPGSAGTPWSFVRWDQADQAADWAGGFEIYVTEGIFFAGTTLRSLPTAAITMGTTMIRFDSPNRIVRPSDLRLGTLHNIRCYDTHFEELVTAISTNNTKIPGTAIVFTSNSGAATQLDQIETSDIVPGSGRLATGSTSTGRCGVQFSGATYPFSTSRQAEYWARVKVPTLSTGSQTFKVFMGLFDVASGTPTNGIYFMLDSDGSAIKAICRHSGAETSNNAGIFTQVTTFRNYRITYDPVTQTAYFFIGATLATSITTNLPDGDNMVGGVSVVKSAGTTDMKVHVDYLEVVQSTASTSEPI